MTKDGCPVCGYKEIEVLNELGWATFEICDCCGCESGYEYNQNSSPQRLASLRDDWVNNRKFQWYSTKESTPIKWDPVK